MNQKFIQIEKIDTSPISGVLNVEVELKYIKEQFLKATRGKNRNNYDISRYAEQIIQQEVVNYLSLEGKQNIVYLKVDLQPGTLSLLGKEKFLTCKVDWEASGLVPEINLLNFKLNQIETAIPEHNDAKLIEAIVQKYAKYEKHEGAIAIGDLVKTEWKTEDGDSEYQVIKMGVQPRLPQDLEDRILESKVGDVIEYTMQVPKNLSGLNLPPKYRKEMIRLSNKDIKINLVIIEAQRLVVPSVQDVVKDGHFESEKAFHDVIQNKQSNWLANMNMNYGMRQIQENISNLEFEVPQSEVSKVVESLKNQISNNNHNHLLELANAKFGCTFTAEQLDAELWQIGNRITRSNYGVRELPKVINLTNQVIETGIFQRLMNLDIQQRTHKEIRQIVNYYRDSWTASIILEHAFEYIKNNQGIILQTLPWNEAEKTFLQHEWYYNHFPGLTWNDSLQRDSNDVNVSNHSELSDNIVNDKMIYNEADEASINEAGQHDNENIATKKVKVGQGTKNKTTK